MKKSLTSLFLELANPDENGQSRRIYKTEFIGEYKDLHFTNGCNWMRSLRNQYLYKTESRGDGWSIQLIGKDTDKSTRNIRNDIKKEIISRKCSHTGFRGNSQNGIECDHKNGRYDVHSVLDTITQTIDDFQPLCRQANLQKRSDCKSCREIGLRFDAKQLDFKVSFLEGGIKYEGSCKGCYWEDCSKFKQSLIFLTNK